MVFVMVPAFTYAQTTQASAATPSISQPLVREGTVAVKLVDVLKLGTTTSETEAESLLSSAGIAPHNGWIADYPVTPDIANELRDAIANAAAAGSLKLDKDAALAAYDGSMSQYNLAFKDDSSGKSGNAQSYPDPTVVNNYYTEQGPPVVTYYAPPADYAYLYSWVPYPFWWTSFWFPGFFVLADFDRPFFFGGHLFFVSNHFFDRDRDDFVRVNAFDRFHRFHDVDRFHDRSFADSRRVIGPSTARTGAETAFRHNVSGNGSGDHRSAAMHEGRRTMSSPARSLAPSGRSTTSRMVNNRSFDRGSTFSRQTDRMPRMSAQPSRSFGSFGGGRSFGGFGGGRSFGHRM